MASERCVRTSTLFNLAIRPRLVPVLKHSSSHSFRSPSPDSYLLTYLLLTYY